MSKYKPTVGINETVSGEGKMRKGKEVNVRHPLRGVCSSSAVLCPLCATLGRPGGAGLARLAGVRGHAAVGHSHAESVQCAAQTALPLDGIVEPAGDPPFTFGSKRRADFTLLMPGQSVAARKLLHTKQAGVVSGQLFILGGVRYGGPTDQIHLCVFSVSCVVECRFRS